MEALSDRDRVSAGSMTSFTAVVVALSDRDRVSIRFAVPPIDVESVKLTDSDRFAVPPVDVESVKPMVSEIKATFAAVVETLSDRDRVSAGSMT